MNIEIISIGNEILSGLTINTNSSYISLQLSKFGYVTRNHRVIPDDPDFIRRAIIESLKTNELTIFTGGLGPTLDDLTKQVVIDVFGSKLLLDEEVAKDLELRFGKDLPSLQEQSHVPDNAIILKNKIGTAPGFLFIKNHSLCAFIPGVPLEMKEMFLNELLPLIQNHFHQIEPFYSKLLHFCGLKEVEVDPLLREMQRENPEITFGIYPSIGHLSIKLAAKQAEILEAPCQFLKENFRDYYFESSSGKIEESIQDKFINLNKTLALAESCTGGAFAAKLTKIPGSSKYFKGSIVSYSNEAKVSLLNVSKETLHIHGAVSRQVVLEMLEGVMQTLSPDVAVAISGIAGPEGGSIEKPVGTVWVGVVFKEGFKFSWCLQLSGTREMIIEETINEVLGILYSKL